MEKATRFWKGLAAAAAAVATLTVPLVPAWAGGGGGNGGDNHSGEHSGQFAQSWAYRDNNDGGFGGPTREAVLAAAGAMGVTMGSGASAWKTADEAVAEANHNCLARFDEAHADQRGEGKCRMVAVGMVTSPEKVYQGVDRASHSIWMNNWADTVIGKTYSNNGAQYTTGAFFQDQPGVSVDKIADQYAGDENSGSIVVIMLNQYEPRPGTYDLSVSTRQQGGFAKAGGTQAVHDLIHADNHGSPITEDVDATVTLTWSGYPNPGPHSRSKTVRMHNKGDTRGPDFRPSDFGWAEWPAGRHGFAVDIPKQGKMSKAVHLADTDPGESWTATPPAPSKSLWNEDDVDPVASDGVVASTVGHVARVEAHTAGSGSLWLYDTELQDVFIGAPGRDDKSKVRVTDSRGVDQRADVSIDRSQAGRVTVKAHVIDWAPRLVVMHVPVYPKADGKPGTLKDDSKACWSGDGSNCQTGDHREIGKVTSRPDKVWEVDPDGVLAAHDEGWTNAKGKDNRYFVPGDRISAGVHGTVKAHLTGDLKAYELADHWADAARYIDFSDASKARVYVDGADRTGDFDVTVEGTDTKAVAKAGFLKGTKGLKADMQVTLVIVGVVKDVDVPEGAKVTNSGSQRLGDEGSDSNVPAVFIRSPKPDKAWVLDAQGGLATADPGWTNGQGKDNRYFVPLDPISSVVNGILPKGLAKDLDAYQIADDWTDAARYIDFSDASKARVYVDGTDRTGDFDVRNEGTTTVATAKASLLRGTENMPSDHQVKLILTGTVKDVDIPEGARFTNSGWERWNSKKTPSNQPPAFVRSPKPDKAWVRDLDEGGRTEDPGWTNAKGADNLVFLDGDKVGAVVDGKLPKGLAKDLDAYVIADDWSGAARYVDFSDASKARVYVDGADRTKDFDVKVEGTATVATAKASLLRGTENMPSDHQVKLYVEGRFKDSTRTGGKLVKLTNSGWEQWDRKKVPANQPPVYVWTPNADKSWVALENGDPQSTSDDYDLVIDPGKTNATGADGHSFRLGDRVASAVNATMPAGLALTPRMVLRDDWSDASRIVTREHAGAIRIYDHETATAEQSTVAAIDAAGRDVTDQFDITETATGATAVPKPAYAKGLAGMDKARQITMLVPFQVRFDPAKLRQEYGKKDGDQLDACTNPDGTTGLDNLAGQAAGTADVDTNRPRICVTVPAIHKDVIGESSQGGSQGSVDGKRVLPGQKIEYTVRVDPLVPATDMYETTRVAVTDVYDAQTTPDRQTLEITDLNTGMVIPRSAWTATWNPGLHSVTAEFAKGWVKANWPKGSHPRILLRFEARVNDDAKPDHVIANTAWLIVNNGAVPSNTVENQPPDIKPVKQVKQKDAGIDINGRTFLLGDRFDYHVTLDASDLKDTAYPVQRLGLIDDYDQEYLKADPTGFRITDAKTGRDVTDRFNIQDDGGVAYAFMKTVDTLIPATGETVKGDPQPTDLKEYAGRKLDPLHDPYVDQGLMGARYDLTLPMTVIKVTDGKTITNQATQVTDDRRDVTNQVSNPVKPIDPSKDVVLRVGDKSVDGRTIYLGDQFLYQLDSSILPAHRAYREISDWSISDTIDTAHDRPTGQWAVYATRDLKGPDGTLLAAKGERIAGSDFDSGRLMGDQFTRDWQDPLMAVKATARYLSYISAEANDGDEQGWRAYIQCERIKAGARIANRFTETINGVQRPSNEVTTSTPDLKPGVKIVKYDVKSGIVKGDRNKPADALRDAKDGTEIAFLVTNTGQLPVTASIKDLEDKTVAGSGRVEDIHWAGAWKGRDTAEIRPGGTAEARGTLKGIAPGGHHTDRASIKVTPIVPCAVADPDPWGHGSGTTDGGPADLDVTAGQSGVTAQITPSQAGKDGAPQPAATGDGKVQAQVKPGDKPDQAKDGTSLDVRPVDGICHGTPIASNKDDWNGVRPDPVKPAKAKHIKLSKTGADARTITLAGLAVALAALILILAAHGLRKETSGRYHLEMLGEQALTDLMDATRDKR